MSISNPFDDKVVDVQSQRVGTTAPTFANVVGGIYMVQFSGSQNDEIHFVIQLPHRYDYNSPVLPHVHFAPSTAMALNETIIWDFEYAIVPIGSAIPVSTVLDPKTYTAPGTVAAGTNLDLDFTPIASTGLKLSTMFICRLSRHANGVGSDTFAGAAWLFGFDFHLQTGNAGGSSAAKPV
jgi:hypothetical protein